MFRTFDIMDLSPVDAGSEPEFDARWGSLPIALAGAVDPGSAEGKPPMTKEASVEGELVRRVGDQSAQSLRYRCLRVLYSAHRCRTIVQDERRSLVY